MADYPVEKPVSVAPNLTPEQRAALAPVDKLVQWIMPRLIDKVNLLEWRVSKLEWETAQRFRETQAVVVWAEKLESRGGPVAVTDMETLVQRIEALEQRGGVPDVEALMRRVEALEAKPARRTTRRKKDQPAPEPHPVVPPVGAPVAGAVADTPVATSIYADYNPDLDEWIPKTICGSLMTASIVEEVRQADERVAEHSYPEAVVAFAKGLSEAAFQLLKARFPE